jgi:hypothetical protein
MNRRILFSLAAAAAVGACSEAPTSTNETTTSPDFVLYGQPDNNEHPFVGFSVFYDPVEKGWFRCSGTLLNDHETFLTAGHCAAGVSSNGHDTWVTFDQHVDLSTFFAATTLAGQKAALNANTDFTRGVSIANPDFGKAFPNTSDVGVVKLDDPVSLSAYGRLAAVNAVNALPKHQVFDIVGYGLQGVKPMVVANLDRVQGQAKLIQVKSGRGFAGPYNLELSSNNGAPHRGGTCFGDSGGPILIGNVVYAVNSYVWNSNCTNASYAFRVDLPAIHNWILAQ